MKKSLFVVYLITFLTIVSSTSILAKDAPTQQTETNRVKVQERIEERKVKTEERKASIEAKVVENRNMRISSFWLHIKRILNSFIERLNNIIGRMEARIAKIDADGGAGDTATAKSEIQKAKVLIADATLKITNIESNLPDALISETPKESFNTLNKDIKTIRKDLIEAHRLLTHAIGGIKGLRMETKESSEVSGTPSVVITKTLTPTPVVTSTPTATLTPTVTVTATLTPTP